MRGLQARWRAGSALLAGIVAAGLPGVAGCAGLATAPTSAASPTVTPASTATTTSPTGTSAAAGTTTFTTITVAATTTTLEPWQVPGRHYYFPIQPPSAASYGEAHHDYPATDIFAPAGTTVVAVTNGVIDELRRDDPWSPEVDDPATRGGRFVSLIGDDGVRYYCAHLEWVAAGLGAGDRVAAGQVVGAVGTSGNAAATPAHCHFGISRPTFPGDWAVRRGQVLPYEYLQAWARGDEVVPRLPAG